MIGNSQEASSQLGFIDHEAAVQADDLACPKCRQSFPDRLKKEVHVFSCKDEEQTVTLTNPHFNGLSVSTRAEAVEERMEVCSPLSARNELTKRSTVHWEFGLTNEN